VTPLDGGTKERNTNLIKNRLIVTVNSLDLGVYNYAKQHVEVPVQQVTTSKMTRK
jgi:hypothetical protein